MTLSIITRMGVGLGVFVILARSLGPKDFGLISATFAYAGLAGLLSDFGLSTRLLRDFAADPTRSATALAEGLVIKSVMATAFTGLGMASMAIMGMSAENIAACAVFGIGVLLGSIGDLAMVSYRAAGRYRSEAIIVGWTSGLYAALIVLAAALHIGAIGMGVGFLGARLMFAVLAITGAFRLSAGQAHPSLTPARIARTMRGSISWALDSGLGYLNGQLDALILPYLLGLSAAGVYLAASRFVLAALALAAVLSNIHIPKLASGGSPLDTLRRERRMFLEFALLGLGFAAFFVLGGPLLTRYVLGPQYASADALWLGFAAFVAARYLAAGVGAALAARGMPRLRVGGQIIGLVTILVATWIWLPSKGLVAMPWIVAAGATATFVAYAAGRATLKSRTR